MQFAAVIFLSEINGMSESSVLGYTNKVSLQCLYKADRMAAVKLDLDPECLMTRQHNQPLKLPAVKWYCSMAACIYKLLICCATALSKHRLFS